jgi:hypothetical protein
MSSLISHQILCNRSWSTTLMVWGDPLSFAVSGNYWWSSCLSCTRRSSIGVWEISWGNLVEEFACSFRDMQTGIVLLQFVRCLSIHGQGLKKQVEFCTKHLHVYILIDWLQDEHNRSKLITHEASPDHLQEVPISSFCLYVPCSIFFPFILTPKNLNSCGIAVFLDCTFIRPNDVFPIIHSPMWMCSGPS